MAGQRRKGEREGRGGGLSPDTPVLTGLTSSHCFICQQDVLTTGWVDLLLHKKEDQNKLKGHFTTTALPVLPCYPAASLPAPSSPSPELPTSSASARLGSAAAPRLSQPRVLPYTKLHRWCLQALNTALAAHFSQLPLQQGS